MSCRSILAQTAIFFATFFIRSGKAKKFADKGEVSSSIHRLVLIWVVFGNVDRK
jgi:hypothetical protein